MKRPKKKKGLKSLKIQLRNIKSSWQKKGDLKDSDTASAYKNKITTKFYQ